MVAGEAPSQFQPQRNPRVLACVLCQHRKIKCDRNTPCSNCLKANITCTPSTPAPARKRRRPNQDLQERLARCEALLKQYSDAGVNAPGPSSSSGPGLGTAPGPESSPLSETYRPAPAVPHQQHQYHQHQQDPPVQPITASPTPSPSTEHQEKHHAGKVVQHEGSSRFIESKMWTSFYEELQAMRKIVDAEGAEESSVPGSDGLTPDNNNNVDLLFSNHSSPRSAEDCHPDPVHAFRLWQIFLDRVNPLTKIIHVPTLQPYVIEATNNPTGIPLSYQALLFSIYLMATVSLSDAECQQILGMSRDQAMGKFTLGTKQVLIRFDFLRNHDMPSLQALLLFLFSLKGRYDRHANWILGGILVRIATKMGYHRDGELLNLNPFETEMRRRIWWQILIHDSALAITSGLNHTIPQSSADSQPPRNVNDADLFPGSQEPVQSREGPTEMAFILMANRFTQFMTSDSSSRAAFEQSVLSQGSNNAAAVVDPAVMDKCQAFLDELRRDVDAIERRYIDAAAGPAHCAAITAGRMVISKLSEMLVPMAEQPEWGTEIFGPRDNFFKVVLINNEHAMDAYEKMVDTGFGWFFKQQFQLDVFAVLTGQLAQHPTGSLSDRGWNVVARTYKWQAELLDMSQRQYVAQAHFTLNSWKAREQAFAACGQPLETPDFIQRLREALPSPEARSSSGMSPTSPANMAPVQQQQQQQQQQPQQQQPSSDLDQLLGGFLDGSSLNWDMWGDMITGDAMDGVNTAAPSAFQPKFGLGGMTQF